MLTNYWIKRSFQAAILVAAVAVPGVAEEHSKGAILERLEAKYVPAVTTDDETDITTAGSILTLRLDNLVTSGVSAGGVCPNTFKDGKITQGKLAAVTCGRAMAMAGQAKRKVFLAGQKLWVTAIEVEDSGVVFKLLTDAYAGERYKATLIFPVVKGSIPAPEEMEAEVAKVFKAEPPPPAVSGSAQQGPGAAPKVGAQSFTSAPAAAPSEDTPPPPIDAPPPPPAEPKTIRLGMTTDQVVANFGQPKSIVRLPTKEIYVFENLKVTFVNHKVTDVQ